MLAISFVIALITYVADITNVSSNPPNIDDPFVNDILNARFLQTSDLKIKSIIDNNEISKEPNYPILIVLPIALLAVTYIYSDSVCLEPLFEKVKNL